jgi:hypothetical protein
MEFLVEGALPESLLGNRSSLAAPVCWQAISFSPGFNRVTSDAVHSQPFSTVYTSAETVETVKEKLD